jgi:hypothetical protein
MIWKLCVEIFHINSNVYRKATKRTDKNMTMSMLIVNEFILFHFKKYLRCFSEINEIRGASFVS